MLQQCLTFRRGATSVMAVLPSRKLVMGIAIGYPLHIYQIFLGTLRATSYTGDITLVVGPNTSAAILTLCAEQQAKVRDAASLGLSLQASSQSRNHLQIMRYQTYMQLCLASQHNFCLATDFRDVFFQRDPFSSFHESMGAQNRPALVLSLEHSNMTTTDEGVNSYWLRVCKGANHSIIGKPIICSGTIYGTPAGFAALGHAFASTRCNGYREGIDQAVLNWLVHAPAHSEPGGHVESPHSSMVRMGDVAVSVTLQVRGTGAVNSLWGYSRTNATSAEMIDQGIGSLDGIVRNVNGKPSPVVHQFDRMVQLLWYTRRFRFDALSKYDKLPCMWHEWQEGDKKLKTTCHFVNGTDGDVRLIHSS